MKILIINQPTNNHGDEAAHKAFLRSLSKKYHQHDFTMLFFHENNDSVHVMNINAQNVHYVNANAGFSKKKYQIIKWAFRFGCEKWLTLLPQFREVERYIKEADKIINAPGGICMGTFHNWEHVYFLKLAQWNNKPVAYYSRSFGPFELIDPSSSVFNSICRELLMDFKFLSIRDYKTMAIADKMHIPYTKGIDTAFLETAQPNTRYLVKEQINTLGNYCVIVPNSLIWHPSFSSCSKEYIDGFYLALIDRIANTYKEIKIVMLPQLFNKADGGDYAYFNHIVNAISDDLNYRIKVFDDTVSSDIQQAIINNASFVIGARYHSIVFAINNSTKFVSLSYEHKMDGLLTMLDLKSQSVPFADWVKRECPVNDCVNIIIEKIENCPDIKPAKDKAKSIAYACETELCNKLNL